MLFGKPSRRMWIVALLASVLCVSGLVYALVTDWDAPSDRTLEPHQRPQATGSGFGLGLALGVGAGVVVGSLLALRKRPGSAAAILEVHDVDQDHRGEQHDA